MKIILRFGIIAPFLAAWLRHNLTDGTAAGFFNLHELAKWELWVYLLALMIGVLSAWHWVIRNRCGECGEGNAIYEGASEKERWVGSDDKGRTVTKVIMRHHYKCRYCQDSTWTRFQEVVKT